MTEINSHVNPSILKQRLDQVTVKPDEIYSHYKDHTKLYQIIMISINEKTQQPTVIYQPLYSELFDLKIPTDRSWSEWSENILYEGETVPRFTLVKSTD